jgi:PPE-repeat protein
VQSSPIDIGDGQQFMFISRLLPDLSFLNSTTLSPTATFTTAVRNYQQGGFSASTASTFTSSTEQFFLRLRGRQMTMRVGSDGLGTTWRLGSPRYDLRPDGRR